MKYYYSKTTNGFYCKEVHGENIPQDAIEVTEEQWENIQIGTDKGYVIAADENGSPVAIDPRTLMTADEKLAQFISQVQNLINQYLYYGNGYYWNKLDSNEQKQYTEWMDKLHSLLNNKKVIKLPEVLSFLNLQYKG